MSRYIDAVQGRFPRLSVIPSGTCPRARSAQEREPLHGESGVYMTFLAMFLVVMTAMVGLALDAGTLYTTRLSMQASADAGAVSGLAKHALSWDNEANGPSAAANIAKLAGEEAARQIALTNLTLKNVVDSNLTLAQLIPNGRIVATTLNHDVANAVPTEMRVQIMIQPRLFLLQRLPGFAHLATINVEARSRLSPAHVSLLIDSSASMACPQTGNCNCLSATASTCIPGNSRLAKVQSAAKGFLKHFNTFKDSVSLVAFGNAASVILPMQNIGFDASTMRTQIDTQLAPYGATNIPDALIRAYNDARTHGHEDELNVIALTDGSITATRVILRDPKTAAEMPTICTNFCAPAHHHRATESRTGSAPPEGWHNPLGPTMDSDTVSKHDYVQVAQVVTYTNPTPGEPDIPVVYPYHLVLTPGYQSPATSHSGYWQQQVPYVIEEVYRVLYSLPSPDNPSEAYSILFNSPNYFMPYESVFANEPPNATGSVPQYRGPFWNGTTYNWALFDALDPLGNRSGFIVEFMNHALAYADFIRQRGGSVSVIATGDRAPNPMYGTAAWTNPAYIPDVYQHRDNASVKYFYLWRLANDRCFGNAQFWMDTVWPGLPTFGASLFKSYVGFPSYQNMRTLRRRHGFVLEAPDVQELDAMFAQSLLRLRMGLIK